MTELYFLDRTLGATAGPIDSFVSLVWEERYGACGSYTLVLPPDRTLFAAALSSSYLEVRGRRGLGRIERVAFSGGEGDTAITVSGRMAESLLADRIIPRGTAVSGVLTEALEAVVAENAGPDAGTRAIPCLTVAHAPALKDAAGAVLTVEDRVSGRPLDEWLYETLGAHGASYRILPDPAHGTLVFGIVRGLDRTQAQTENSFAVFSASFASSGEFDFLSDCGDHRNFAFIAGEGEGEDRVTVTLDLRTAEDEPLRELYVDARDLRSVDEHGQMSDQAYRNLLLSRGRQRLLAHAAVERIDGTAAIYTEEEHGSGVVSDGIPAWGEGLAPIGGRVSTSMICGVHYDLGDLCDIASEVLGMQWSARVTAVRYIYEGSRVRVEPRFGTAYPDLRTFIHRHVADRA